MADDKNKNQDPEDNDDLFDDDEDFGLPDLDYDDLDDEFDDDLLDEEIEDDSIEELEEPALEPIVESTTETESAQGSLVDEEININDELSNDTDSDIPDGEDWELELEKELEDELSSGEVDSFYEEESFDEFESEEADSNVFDTDSDESQKQTDEVTVESGFVPDNSEDKNDYYTSHIKKDEEAKAKESAEEMSPEEYAKYFGDGAEKNKSKFTRTVVIGTISLLVIGSLFLYLSDTFGTGEDPKEIVKTEKAPLKKVEPVEKKEAPKTTPKPKPKPEPIKQVAGEIKTIDQATGKSYIVIASFFDSDMANDHAKTLAEQGKSPIIIPPFNEYRFYRVAIAGFDSFADAKAELPQYQSEFGKDVWPLRY
ncbi:MAG: hypothetical protein ACI9A7_000845 [Cyclobacteriaceae bacterium]|jgi:hypothetical protein